MSAETAFEGDLRPLEFSALPGWETDDHASAFAAFLRSARQMVQQPPRDGWLGVHGRDLQRIARAALVLDGAKDPLKARQFFETWFQPVSVLPRAEQPFLTGYFEPEVGGSLTPSDHFRYPLFKRPADLVDVTDANRPEGFDAAYMFARATGDGLRPYFDRSEIEDGALAGRGLELVYLADPVDVFFIHVQGSATIRLADRRMRVAYAAKAGHPYTSIGKRLIEQGLATPETMTLDSLRRWLKDHPDDGARLMRLNRSYVFFRELDQIGLDPDLGAIAAAGVQITPGRSLAVDHRLHAYGTPVWIEADLPLGDAGSLLSVHRLLIAQDTGSAIVGAARGDLFCGLGASAGKRAGCIRHIPRTFVMLKPI